MHCVADGTQKKAAFIMTVVYPDFSRNATFLRWEKKKNGGKQEKIPVKQQYDCGECMMIYVAFIALT